jgi:hypothetical protein
MNEMTEQNPRPAPGLPHSRRDRLRALLFHAAAIGAAVLMFAHGPKEPIGAGE